MILKAANELERVAGLRIAVWAEHAHQALRRFGGQATQLLKANSRVGVVAKDRLAGIQIA